MRAQKIWPLLALTVMVAAPCGAQENKPNPLPSTQNQNVPAAKTQARLKKVNRRFNKRYGKKTPQAKATRVRIDESKNQVRQFNKEAPVSRTTAGSASKTRPNTGAGQGQPTTDSTKAAPIKQDQVAKRVAQNKEVLEKGNRAADKRLQERLRRNEEIRHKGDEARVKRNLAKLKTKMKPGEVTRGRNVLEATKAKEAARAAEAAKAARAAEVAKTARAAQATRAAQTARAAQALRAARAGRGVATAARAATASTGVGIALVAGSIVAEQIVMQEIEHPGKTARDINGFFNGLVGAAAVSGTDNAPASSAIYDTFRIETGKAVVRAVPNGRKGYTTIQFATNLDWWTALIIRDRSGKVIEVSRVDRKYHLRINRQNGGAKNAVVIATAHLPAQVQFEFWTAKTLGIHKQMVIMKYRRERLDARTVGVTWSK